MAKKSMLIFGHRRLILSITCPNYRVFGWNQVLDITKFILLIYIFSANYSLISLKCGIYAHSSIVLSWFAWHSITKNIKFGNIISTLSCFRVFQKVFLAKPRPFFVVRTSSRRKMGVAQPRKTFRKKETT